MTPTLTHGALQQLYANKCWVAIGEDLLELVEGSLPSSVGFLVLEATGRMRLPEDASLEQPALNPVGMALGLKVILAGSQSEVAAKAWATFADDQKMFEPIACHVLSGRAAVQKAKLLSVLATEAAGQMQALQSQLARQEAQQVFLRQKNERLLLSLERAQRMIRGAGYSLQTITAELPVGDQTIGPGGDLDTDKIVQILPSDAAGLRGLGLRVARSAEGADDSELKHQAVEFRVLRRGDGAVLSSQTRTYAELNEGWCYLAFESQSNITFGDTELHVSWPSSETSRAPLFALADVISDRFGDTEGRSLAVRVYSGICPLPPAEIDAGSDKTSVPSGSLHSVSAATIAEKGQWPFSSQAAQDHAPLEIAGEWFQTHALPDRPSGVQLPALLERGTVSVSATVKTHHPSGPSCFYFLVAAPRSMPVPEAVDRLQGVITSVRAGERPMASGSMEGIYYACTLLAPNCQGSLSLQLGDALSEDTADLYLIAQSASENAAYGWCRWRDLRIERQVEGQRTELAPIDQSAEPENLLLMRTLTFPELTGRIQFIAGKAKLLELSRSLGFSPLLISDQTGSLQTHPLQEGQVSAAIYPGGVPSGAIRVASTVETAHESAPAFIYILAVLDPDMKEKERAVHNLLGRVNPDIPGSWQGVTPNGKVQWQARVLFARTPSLLELELTEAVNRAHDVVFAVKPAVESVSYGWCRWYSYNVTTVPQIETVPVSQAEDEA